MKLDLAQLHAWANRELPARVQALRRLGLHGTGDGEVVVEVAFAWKGLPASVSLRVREIKVMHGFFGCQVVSVHGPLGLPLPVSMVARIVQRLLPGKVRYDHDDGVFLLNLGEWLPQGIEVTVRRVHCGTHALELELGPGSLRPRTPALGAGSGGLHG